MEGSATRVKIMEESIKLFSIQGFEATSISQIADAVGIKKASLYSHFASKKEILDCIMEEVARNYSSNSIFTRANWDDPDYRAGLSTEISLDDIVDQIKNQVRFTLHAPKVMMVRKMLTIEQFRNPEMAAACTEHFYEDILQYHMGLIRFLISAGVLIEGDVEIMAAQYCFPVSMWLNLCDRDPNREDEIMDLIERNVKQFYKVYGKRQ